MKITVVTDPTGGIVGTIGGHQLSVKKGDSEAGIFLGPGQKAHHLDVDDALGKLIDPLELHAKLASQLPKA